MNGTSYISFFSGVTKGLVALSGMEKISDKVAMLLGANINDIAFNRTTKGNGLIDIVYLLDSEVPDPVIQYRIKETIESGVPYCRVYKVLVSRVSNQVTITVQLVYLGEETTVEFTVGE